MRPHHRSASPHVSLAGKLLGAVSLAALAVVAGHALAVPGVAATLAALVAVCSLPVVVPAAAVKAVVAVRERTGRSAGQCASPGVAARTHAATEA